MAQNANGTPHFTYYDENRDLSFIWDGKSQFIEVCPNGYGEPAEYSFSTELSAPPTSAHQTHVWLNWFKGKCDDWVHPDDEDEEEEEDDEEEEDNWSNMQPCCDGCWTEKHGTLVPQRVARTRETCTYCGTTNVSGIFVRVTPGEDGAVYLTHTE